MQRKLRKKQWCELWDAKNVLEDILGRERLRGDDAKRIHRAAEILTTIAAELAEGETECEFKQV